jgi:hypothetical protein
MINQVRTTRQKGRMDMNMIIDGKKYDTDTAEKVAGWGNGLHHGDFKHVYEELYRTSKGSWFLHGEGGPMSPYAEGIGRERWNGQRIVPMTDTEAQAWLESHRRVEALEKWFAESIIDA